MAKETIMNYEQNKEWGINEYRNHLESELLEAQLNADSPYNDGWTQQGAKEKVIILKEKLKKVGTQLKFNF
tara:strand:+ start:295 stop:507 length:213 start_codon:yes stop_codon:yes gene_type:complete